MGFLWAFAALVALMVFGTTGYRIIEHPGLAVAFYMTVITLTAVGYQEVWQLSPAGRGFTVVLLLGSPGSAGTRGSGKRPRDRGA